MISDVNIGQIFVAIPATIIALATLIGTIKLSRKSDTIITSTNGQLSKLQEDLAAARASLSEQHKEIAELRILLTVRMENLVQGRNTK